MDRIVGELLQQGPDRCRAAARPQPHPRELRARRRAPGRLRRSLRHPRAEHDATTARPTATSIGSSASRTATAAEVRDTQPHAGSTRRTTRSLVTPFPALHAGTDDASIARCCRRSASRPTSTFPAVQRAKLANGLSVMLIERHSTPLVNVSLAVDAGYAADSAEQGRRRVARARPARRRHDDARHVQDRRRARRARRAHHDRQLARPVVRAPAGAARATCGRRSPSSPTSS